MIDPLLWLNPMRYYREMRERHLKAHGKPMPMPKSKEPTK